MNNRVLTSLLLLAASAAAAPSAFAQSYPPPPGYTQPLEPVSSGAGSTSQGASSDFDGFDNPRDRSSRAAVAQQAASQGPILSPDDPRYGRPPVQAAAPQGPILSPDDPRYGLPPGASTSAAAYSDRAAAVMGDGNRPPGVVDAQASAPRYDSQGRPMTVAALPPDDQPETGPRQELPPQLRRQEVDYVTKEPAGTIIVDTAHTYLYYILGNGHAIRYGVRVGRDGFRWNGVQRITRKAEWPDWHPPAEMIERQPYLPRFMAGGDGNPLGARAMYLGSTVYRIHGTNQPSTIGKYVSSGCIGMLNEDVEDLFDRVKVGTRVVVLPGSPPGESASAQPADSNATYGQSANASAMAGVPGQGPTTVPQLPAPVNVR